MLPSLHEGGSQAQVPKQDLGHALQQAMAASDSAHPREEDPGFHSGAFPTGLGRRRTVDELGERLVKLCHAAELGAATAQAERIFHDLIAPSTYLADFAAGKRQGWASEISDDNTPIEFSMTLAEAGAEVRVLFEPQGEALTLAAQREAALALHLELEREHGANLERLRRIEDLFLPIGMQGPFALWSAVVFSAHHPPAFKAYCNPQAQGVGRSAALVDEALRRLGLTRAWPNLTRALLRRGPHYDELKYLALDLSTDPQARVKVYVRHHDASPEDLEMAAAASPSYSAGETASFARAMGGRAERFHERAPFTCAAYVEGQDHAPAATTQYLPVCAYARDDAKVEERITRHMQELGLDPEPYRRALQAFATRPLDAGVGLQSWAALRRYQNALRLTVYLASEVRCVYAPGSVPAATSDHSRFSSTSEVLKLLEAYDLRHHPLYSAPGFSPSGVLLEWAAQMVGELLAIDAQEQTPASAGARAAGVLCLSQLTNQAAPRDPAAPANDSDAAGLQEPELDGADALEAFAGGALAAQALFWKLLDDIDLEQRELS